MFKWFRKTEKVGKVVAELKVATLREGDLNTSPALRESEDLLKLGNSHLENGRLGLAAESYQRALALNPKNVKACTNLGYIFEKQGIPGEALTYYRKAVGLDPNQITAHQNLGFLLMGLGQSEEAGVILSRLLELAPEHPGALNCLGVIAAQRGDFPRAESLLRRALVAQPDFVEAYNNLGNLFKHIKRHPEAEVAYRRTLVLKPDFAEANNNLGALLIENNRLAEAEVFFHKAIELQPNYVEAHNNLGNLLKQTKRMIEAEASYRCAIKFNPLYADAYFNLSLLLLSLGRYAEAWPLFEYRFDPGIGISRGALPNLPCPQWRGELLVGKTLVIWPEQGLGDYIQFVRYAQLLRESGVSRLTLVCIPPLKALLETVAGVDAVIADFDSIPPHDYWTYPLSLPLRFGTAVDNIPSAVPYLQALPARVARWRDHLPVGKLYVGLVWKGNADHKNDANRSLPGLSTLAPLWSVQGVTFISLQKGAGEAEAKYPPGNQPIVALGSEIADLADTAAIVALLDFVICVDTSIAHLAGALGKPCWVLLPSIDTDWRWLGERGDSPWYPTMRLFRQEGTGDWGKTVERVREALAVLAHTGT